MMLNKPPQQLSLFPGPVALRNSRPSRRVLGIHQQSPTMFETATLISSRFQRDADWTTRAGALEGERVPTGYRIGSNLNQIRATDSLGSFAGLPLNSELDLLKCSHSESFRT